MGRLARWFAAGIAAMGVTALIPIPAASASAGCSDSNICYARAWWQVSAPAGFEGGELDLRTNCMTDSDPTTQIMTNEMWVADYSAAYWTEAGISIGPRDGGGVSYYPSYYWADNRPNGGGYHEHWFGEYSPLDTDEYSHIQETSAGSGSWSVNVGGNLGTSTSNFSGPAGVLTTGTESHTDTGHTWGHSANMGYFNTSFAERSGWAAGGAGNAVIEPVPSGFTAAWVTPYTEIHDGEGSTC